MTDQHPKETMRVELLRDSEGQILTIPSAFELPTGQVLITQEGDQLVISPIAEVATQGRPISNLKIKP